MSQKKIKSAKKFTVKQVLQSLEWGIEEGKLTLLSLITDEYISIDLKAIIQKANGETKQN